MSLKKILRSNYILYSLVRWVYARCTGTWNQSASYWIAALIKEEDAQIVQIGSNDGRSGDPVYHLIQARKGWCGLFVEPIPYLFERLKSNYGSHERFRFENSVINTGEQVAFYWVDPSAKQADENLPDWYDQLGSFDRSHIIRCLPELEPYVVESRLNGISVEALLNKHRIEKIDLLHIDTEGYDYKILSQLNLETRRPKVILYERKHLTEEEVRLAIKLLSPYYTLYNLGGDTLAVPGHANKRMQSSGLSPLREAGTQG